MLYGGDKIVPIAKRIAFRCGAIGFLVLTAFGSAALYAHEPDTEPEYFVYDATDEVRAATVLGDPNRYDADVVSTDEGLLLAWLEFVPGEGDRVWVGLRRNGEWVNKKSMTDSLAAYAGPTLTRDANGTIWLSYEAETSLGWDVYVGRLDDEHDLIEPRRVSPSATVDIAHRAAADPAGGLWLVWKTDRDGQFDIVARYVDEDGLGEVQTVADSPRGDWHPAVAAGGDGALCVVWDAYDGESFNVHARRLSAGSWAEPIAIAAKPAFEGRADIAVDSQGRFWIAWEEGAENWGHVYRARRGIIENYVHLGDKRGPLHRYRTIRVACIDRDGRVKLLTEPLPQPSNELARRRPNSGEKVLPHGAFYERARLTVDLHDRPWIFYRHYYAPWMGIDPHHHVEGGWGVFARYLSASGWSPLYGFDVGQGDGLQSLALAPHKDGVEAIWTTGRTDRRKNDRPRGLVVASLKGVGRAPNPGEPLEENGAPSDGKRRIDIPARHEAMQAGGARYQLFFGDLHRHTDLSLCFVPSDGTMDDAYRYAIDVARLDFLGITDHSRDLALGDALSQLWWRSRKQVTRHRLGPTFLPFFAYERSRGDTDHNVISLRDDMLRRHTYPLPQFWSELDNDTFTIAHQPFNRVLWKHRDDANRPLLEIFQGCRDRSVEEDAHEGLNGGHRFGFIASSDHLSTSASYAGVWAGEATNESIFRAMQARRTFGATDKIRLAVRAGEHWMGEQVAATEMPPLAITADGTAPIRQIDIIVDGRVHESLSPGVQNVELRHAIELAGSHYLYVRLLQADGNQAWSSPMWVEVGE